MRSRMRTRSRSNSRERLGTRRRRLSPEHWLAAIDDTLHHTVEAGDKSAALDLLLERLAPAAEVRPTSLPRKGFEYGGNDRGSARGVRYSWGRGPGPRRPDAQRGRKIVNVTSSVQGRNCSWA